VVTVQTVIRRTDIVSGWQRWIGFTAMSIGMFMAVLDIQIVASSLPEIQAALTIPLDRLGWVQTA
jgi:DHA2 family multidrug resistance protein